MPRGIKIWLFTHEKKQFIKMDLKNATMRKKKLAYHKDKGC